MSPGPPAALLAGCFGAREPGVDATLQAFVTALNGADLTIASSDPRRTIAQHAVPAVPASPIRRLLPSAGRVDAVVFAGSSPFHPTAGTAGIGLRRAVALASVARSNRTSVLLSGVGATLLRSRANRMLARDLARLADLLVVRDETAALALVDAGVPKPVRVGADPVWTVVGPRPGDRPRGDTVVVVPGPALDTPATAARLSAAVGRLADAGLRVRIDPWQVAAEQDDTDRARRLAAGRSGITIADAPDGFGEAVDRLADAALVISLRVHGQVAAAAAGVPCLSVTAEPEQPALAARLGQPWVGVSGPAGELAAAALGALEGGSANEAAVKSEIVAAHSELDLLRLMLGVGEVGATAIDGLRLEPTL
jgi:polysaccharide pyruvyl transferase WcaK-like protein